MLFYFLMSKSVPANLLCHKLLENCSESLSDEKKSSFDWEAEF